MIITEHRLTITAICPVDGSRDIYKMTVETTEMLEVERILTTVEASTREPMYQENLTQWLADGLGAIVTLEGTHSGVETLSRAEPVF